MTGAEICVAPLFVPGHRSDRFAKADASAADAIILDLEDAVPREAKDEARQATSLAFTDKPVIVRVNAAGTPWHSSDLAALADRSWAAIMLPKAESLEDIAGAASVAPVIALIETAKGLAMARGIAQSGLVLRLAFGSLDYVADLGCDHDREALLLARSEMVLASRLGNLCAPLDGVTPDISDVRTAAADAHHAAALGFGGKLLIHPVQAQSVLDAFLPTSKDIAWAENVLATGDGVTSLGGMMIDEPVRRRARAIIVRHRRSGPAVEPDHP